MKAKKLFFCLIFLFFSLPFILKVNAESIPTLTPTVSAGQTAQQPPEGERNIYLVEVKDAEELDSISLNMLSNAQGVTLEVLSGDKKGAQVDTELVFPNPQFKEPLHRGDKVIIETIGELAAQPKITILSKYRQNNLLVWAFMLIGLFILVAGFKTNIKYLLIFIISIISGLILIFTYHQNTFLAFGGLFLWLVLSTTWFAYRIFRKRIPSLVLTVSVLGNLIISMGLAFIMKSINLFDTSFFELFLTISYDAREVIIYIFAILVAYPLSVVFADQIISESIKKKREENDILKINMIRHVSNSALKTLNNIFLTFFGLFYAIFVGVISIASKEGIAFQVINSSSLSQILSVGLLILFDLLIFVPIVSFISGIWLGRLESHELVTDQNLRQLEL